MPDCDEIGIGIHRLTEGVRFRRSEHCDNPEYRPFIDTCLSRLVDLRDHHSFVKAFELAHTEMIIAYLKYKLVPPVIVEPEEMKGDGCEPAHRSIPTDV